MRISAFASPLIVVGALALVTPGAALAQDFLGAIARSAAQSAAQGLVNRAVQSATRPSTTTPARPPATTSAATAQNTTAAASTPPQATAGGLAQDFPAPRPINFTGSLRDPTEMKFSQADEDARRAFDEIGRYACSSCEGGYNFDSWVRHEVPRMWGQYVLENHLGGLAVGQALRWTGSHTRTAYAITVVSDRAIGQWPCKQLKWTADRGTTHVERLGLICKPTDNWHTAL